MTARSPRPSAPAELPSRAALSTSLEQSLRAAHEALERLRITLGSPSLRREPSARPTEAGGDAAVLSQV